MAKEIIFHDTEIKDKKMFYEMLKGNISDDIISASLNYLEKHPDIDSVVISKLIFGASMELPRGTTMEQAFEIYDRAIDSAVAEYKRKEKEYRDSPEGQAKIKREQEENERAKIKREQEEKEKVKEVFEALEKVKPLSLKSELTSMKQAVSFCKKIMVILSKCEGLCFNNDEQKLLSDLLKQKGACKHDDAHNKFKWTEGKKVGEMINTPDSIEFPLWAFDHLIDSSQTTFIAGMRKIPEGGEKYSWAMQWVNTQKATIEERAE